MVFGSQHSLLELNMDRVHTIDTRSLEDLSGLWRVFSKTAEALENGKRLENLSWRLWNRETFCCCPAQKASRTATSSSAATDAPPRKSSHVPDLASSLDTVDSDDDQSEDLDSDHSSSAVSNILRPELVRLDSNGLRTQKHITTGTLEKIVVSIKETQEVEPKELDLPELPALSASPVTAQVPSPAPPAQVVPPSTLQQQQQQQPAVQTQNLPIRTVTQRSSTTTVSNAATAGSPSVAASSSDTSSSTTAMSTHEVVRGFVPGGRPSSYRSQTQLAQPTPVLKNSPRTLPRTKQKGGALFTLGGSSGEDESSLESHLYKSSLSSLSEGLHRQGARKQASFRDDNLVSKIQDSPVFESDDEEDEDEVSDGVIEDDEDSSDWEDDMADDDDRSETDDGPLFQRVDSRPNLTVHRSLITTQLHEGDRAQALQKAALQDAASKFAPALRRAQTTPSETSTRASSPARPMHGPDGSATAALPISRGAANVKDRLALSPRTTRRNMLSSELTESLRRNLLWERQHKSSQNLAALRRRHTSQDVKNLKQFPEPVHLPRNDNQIVFTNEYFHAGLGEYHSKGW